MSSITPTNYCVFILSHKRPNKVKTFDTLKTHGYTGPIFIIVDDLDSEISEYKKNFKDGVIVFDKKKYADKTDRGINLDNLSSVVFARNACWDIAKDLGYDFFLVLDDDYDRFEYRRLISIQNEIKLKLNNLDSIFLLFFTYLYESKNIDCLAFFQSGDYIGGDENVSNRKPRRKIMNSFFCSTANSFSFSGLMNDDVNTYLLHGAVGRIFFSFHLTSLNQAPTQKNSGGLTELYLDFGTYVKSFYSVMMAPSCCSISSMGTTDPRIHHKINWNNAVPKILPEKFKKIPMPTHPASEHRQKKPLKTKFTEAEAEQVSIPDDTF